MREGMDLASNLKRILKDRDMTVAQLARATNVPKTTLANWMAGVPPKNISQLKSIADFLSVSIDVLCFDRPSPRQEKINSTEIVEEELLAGVYEVILRRYKGRRL